MATKPRVSLSNSFPSTATTGFLPIRAPITLDDDSSDFQSDGYKTDNSDSSTNVSCVSAGNGYVSGFASGEEFETASDRPFVGGPDEESNEDNDFIDKYQLSRPFVADTDEESLANSVLEEEEESGVTEEYGPLVELDSPNLKPVRPVAQLSVEDDDFDELVDDVGEAEDDKLLGVLKLPNSVGRIDPMPRVKVLGIEEDRGEELLVESDSSVVNTSELLESDEFSALDEASAAGIGVLGSKDEVVLKGSDNYSVSVELVDRHGHVESLVGSEKDIWNDAKLDGNVELFEEERLLHQNLEGEKIELNDRDGHEVKIIDCTRTNRETMQFNATQIKQQIAKVVDGSAKSYEGAGVEAVEPLDCYITEYDTAVGGRIDSEKCIDSETSQFKNWPETFMVLESTALEDASIDNAIRTNEIQAMRLSGNAYLPETSEGDMLEDAWQSNTSSLDNTRDEAGGHSGKIGAKKKLFSDDKQKLSFGGPGTTKHIMNEPDKSLTFFHSGSDVSHKQPERIDGQIIMDSDEEVDANGEKKGEVLFDPAALAGLLKAVTSAESNQGRPLFLECGAGSGSFFQSMRSHLPLYMAEDVVKDNLREEEKEMLEKMQHIGVKFLRLVHRLGHSPEHPIVAEVLHRLALAARGPDSQVFSFETAKRAAMQLEEGGKDDLDVSLNILVLGKTGVGKSATINSIFGEKKVMINAFEPATTRVKEIVGIIDGVRIRILDTPGLRSNVKEEAINQKILASVKKFVKKFRPDVVLYVDRLDTHDGDFNDLPLLNSLTKSLTKSIWKNTIITLTHAASPPPDGPSGSPLSFELYVAQRSRVVQQAICHAVSDVRLLHPSMRNPVSLVENHPLCQKNENKESVFPDGRSWRPQLLLLCYSLKILSEASSISKPQDPSDQKKLFGLRLRPLPLPHLVSSLLQSRPHPKLAADNGRDEIDLDVEKRDLSDAIEEDEDDYDLLPPFKPLRKSQVDKLNKEQKKAYFEEYDYRVKLLQKKHLREQVKQFKEIKKRGKDGRKNPGCIEDVDQEDGSSATVPVPIPDFVLPPTFDSDNPSYRYRILETTSHLLVRPVLDSQGWDHDCGYDGLSIEGNPAVAGQFPGAFAIQMTKDKKDFNIHLDSSIYVKHGENGSTMAGFDIQTVARQLAYILRSETEFHNFKMNKTSVGITITLLGEKMATGLKIEDQIAVGRRLALVGSAGTVTSRGDDTAYGANFEVRVRSKDFPIEQDQSTLGLSLRSWRGDVGMVVTLQSQFSVGRNSKTSIHVGMNNKRRGQITLKTSSLELQTALVSVLPIAVSIFRRIYPGGGALRNSNLVD